MKRFSRYKFALDALRTPDAADDAIPPDAPNGSALREVQLFLAKKKRLNIVRSTASLQGPILQAVIQPFGLPSVDSNKTNVPISTRANGAVGTFMTSAVDDLNHLAGGPGKDLSGFQPAKVVIKNGASASTKPKSKISGENYNTRVGPTYTFPFGAGAGTDEKFEMEVRAKITTAINTKLPRANFTFKAEGLKKR